MSRKLHVYLYNDKIGVLYEDSIGNLSFQYEKDAPYPLSVRLPVRTEVYDKKYTEPYFENLTPEGDVLTTITHKFRISEDNTFSILANIGGDCAGAVSLYDEGYLLNKDITPRSLQQNELKSELNFIARMFDIEMKLCETEPYKDFSVFHHVLLRKL